LSLGSEGFKDDCTQWKEGSMIPVGEPGRADPERSGARWYVALLATVVAMAIIWWIAERPVNEPGHTILTSDGR
jgi:hypothetical protein